MSLFSFTQFKNIVETTYLEEKKMVVFKLLTILIGLIFWYLCPGNSMTPPFQQYNVSECKENYAHLLDDYKNLYNTSLFLYEECTKQMDTYMDLFENEMSVNDVCMAQVQRCENNNRNFSNSVNYTNYMALLKENIELESALQLLKQQKEKCEEKSTVGKSLIGDYKSEIQNLRDNLTFLTREIYGLDTDLKLCKDEVQQQNNKIGTIFTNLESCLEREEENLENKKKYVLRLTSCRKNNKNLKEKCHIKKSSDTDLQTEIFL